MQVFDSISSVLRQKQSGVFWVSPDTDVETALRIMAEQEIGCLLVLREGELFGIFSERDYARKVTAWRKPSGRSEVRELMSSPVITVAPDTSVDEAMRIMTQRRVRHLPVIDKGKIIGLVSIGDLVKWIISSQSRTICELQNYISGNYDVTAGHLLAVSY
jgi:CBS domain-containing protein